MHRLTSTLREHDLYREFSQEVRFTWVLLSATKKLLVGSKLILPTGTGLLSIAFEAFHGQMLVSSALDRRTVKAAMLFVALSSRVIRSQIAKIELAPDTTWVIMRAPLAISRECSLGVFIKSDDLRLASTQSELEVWLGGCTGMGVSVTAKLVPNNDREGVFAHVVEGDGILLVAYARDEHHVGAVRIADVALVIEPVASDVRGGSTTKATVRATLGIADYARATGDLVCWKWNIIHDIGCRCLLRAVILLEIAARPGGGRHWCSSRSCESWRIADSLEIDRRQIERDRIPIYIGEVPPLFVVVPMVGWLRKRTFKAESGQKDGAVAHSAVVRQWVTIFDVGSGYRELVRALERFLSVQRLFESKNEWQQSDAESETDGRVG